MDEAVQVLKQKGSVDIIVEGYTDSVGTREGAMCRLIVRRVDGKLQ